MVNIIEWLVIIGAFAPMIIGVLRLWLALR
jgi:hypothetical protein